jgi:hypothetical protein
MVHGVPSDSSEFAAFSKYFQVELEKNDPHSQVRVLGGKLPHIWSQSLYIVAGLLSEVTNVLNICINLLHGLLDNTFFVQSFLEPGELDPLNRRHATTPGPDICVQGICVFGQPLHEIPLICILLNSYLFFVFNHATSHANGGKSNNLCTIFLRI